MTADPTLQEPALLHTQRLLPVPDDWQDWLTDWLSSAADGDRLVYHETASTLAEAARVDRRLYNLAADLRDLGSLGALQLHFRRLPAGPDGLARGQYLAIRRRVRRR